MFISVVKLGIYTGVHRDSLLQPPSSGDSSDCRFWHFHFGSLLKLCKLPPGAGGAEVAGRE